MKIPSFNFLASKQINDYEITELRFKKERPITFNNRNKIFSDNQIERFTIKCFFTEILNGIRRAFTMTIEYIFCIILTPDT